MAQYAYLAIITILILALTTITTLYIKLQNNYTDCQISLTNANTTLDVQNKEILKQKVDLESYKEAQPEIRERIVTQYKTIEIPNHTCEAQLKAISNAVDLFYKSHYEAHK